MKAQFKYIFRDALYSRGIALAAILFVDMVFITLGSLFLLPLPAQVTAVSLGGCFIAVMLVFDIVGDIAISKRMFSAPEAYLGALTPALRRDTLLTSVISMLAMDVVSMAVVIFCQVWLANNYIGMGMWRNIWGLLTSNPSVIIYGIQLILLTVACYLMIMTLIMFCAAAGKSLFYRMRAGKLLAFIMALGIFYAFSLLSIVMAPFGTVVRMGIFFHVDVAGAGMSLYILLTYVKAAALFFATAGLMERRLNI